MPRLGPIKREDLIFYLRWVNSDSMMGLNVERVRTVRNIGDGWDQSN